MILSSPLASSPKVRRPDPPADEDRLSPLLMLAHPIHSQITFFIVKSRIMTFLMIIMIILPSTVSPSSTCSSPSLLICSSPSFSMVKLSSVSFKRILTLMMMIAMITIIVMAMIVMSTNQAAWERFEKHCKETVQRADRS